MKNLFISYTETRDFITAILSGRLTSLDAMMLKSMLPERSKDHPNIIVDLTGVHEIDLMGMNALLMTNRKMKQKGKKFILKIQEDHPIKELLHLTKFTNQFVYSN